MWGLNGKSYLTIGVYLSIHAVAATLVFGCQDRRTFYDANRSDINKIPQQIENPDNPIPDVPSTEQPDPTIDDSTTAPNEPVIVVTPEEPTSPTSGSTSVSGTPSASSTVPTPEQPTPPQLPSKPTEPGVAHPPSKFIQNAFWVVQNEAGKIGKACNFYVSRVLALSGYSDDSFLANDFDTYAREHFSSYKEEVFTLRNVEAEKLRLKRHIWSYPQRTPFILQWTRTYPKHGHIAIIERIGEQLVIYQASMGKSGHLARREQTNLNQLINYNRAHLTAYSEFIDK